MLCADFKFFCLFAKVFRPKSHMALQYVQEHLSCNLYLTKHKIFIIRDACRGEIIQRTDPEKTALVFVEKGTILVKYGDGQELLAQTNKLYLLPALIQATHTALEDTRLLVCHLSGEIKLCSKFYLQQLTQHVAPNYRSMVYPLEANECIQTYARHLINALNEGLGCIHYHTPSNVTSSFCIFEPATQKKHWHASSIPFWERTSISRISSLKTTFTIKM